MNQLPVLFASRDLILGNGFLAGVDIAGRALMSQESDSEFWFEGINPGGITGEGSSFADAYAAFKETYLNVLFDIAADSATFTEFKAGVESLFNNVSPALLADWNAAVEAVRRGECASDWLRTSRQPNGEVRIQVDELHVFRAADNAQKNNLALAS